MQTLIKLSCYVIMDIDKAYTLISDKLTDWANDFIKLLPNIALASLILVVGFFIAKLLKRIVNRMLSKVFDNETLYKLFSSIIYIFLLGIVIFTALSVLQLDKAVTSILAGAGILGLALAFAFQDIAANFMSGIFMSIRRPIAIGDVVKIQGYMGTIAEVNLRDTVIKTFEGQMVIIPNKTIFQSPIENYTTLGKRRIDLELGISYGDDLDLVKKVTLAAVKDIEGISTEDPTKMFFTSFGDSSINLVLQLWFSTRDDANFLEIRSQAIIAIKKAYDEEKISIPFPIRTLDFGIKGGVALNEVRS